MKKGLVIYYTQTGQAKDVIDSYCSGFKQTEFSFYEIKPSTPFPFPWNTFQFFNAFPETFSQKPIELVSPPKHAFDDYDFITLVYQPWFLTPSPPITSFLQTENALSILKNKSVITISCSRNMWLGAQEKVKSHLSKLSADLVGNIAVVDKSPNLKSVITILRWMLTGKKNPFFIFPKAGIQEAEIKKAKDFGEIVENCVLVKDTITLQEKLNNAGAVEINSSLVLLEKRGQKAFRLWSKFIGNADPNSIQRKGRVRLFSILLPTVVFILSPILTVLSTIILKINRQKLENVASKFMQNKPVDYF